MKENRCSGSRSGRLGPGRRAGVVRGGQGRAGLRAVPGGGSPVAHRAGGLHQGGAEAAVLGRRAGVGGGDGGMLRFRSWDTAR